MLFTAVAAATAPGGGLIRGRSRVNSVHFTPCARTAWHTHAVGQTLHVTEGIGLVTTGDGQVIAGGGAATGAAHTRHAGHIHHATRCLTTRATQWTTCRSRAHTAGNVYTVSRLACPVTPRIIDRYGSVPTLPRRDGAPISMPNRRASTPPAPSPRIAARAAHTDGGGGCNTRHPAIDSRVCPSTIASRISRDTSGSSCSPTPDAG